MIAQLLDLGLMRREIEGLEELNDVAVLNRLPGGLRWLKRNDHDDVVSYLRTWANLLEETCTPVKRVETPARDVVGV